jgi:hypothetical protein
VGEKMTEGELEMLAQGLEGVEVVAAQKSQLQ